MIFLIALRLVQRLLPQAGSIFFIGSMFVIGWGAHGASLLSVGVGGAFLLLAGLYCRVASERGYMTGYVANVAAHMVWNLGVLLASFWLTLGPP
ncbi:hypothetical protein CLG96_11330 [Sphingomonas oleivorans]|uniref:CPBP family intramembrane metalloprotease n=1 Tax=Sphingomonas oleivorans TaxID=1735121 RepID=A0A2T5FXW4_9SPHN|nr:hypothetical protein CLG96_11330 [Sphingomonas oleivorans]